MSKNLFPITTQSQLAVPFVQGSEELNYVNNIPYVPILIPFQKAKQKANLLLHKYPETKSPISSENRTLDKGIIGPPTDTANTDKLFDIDNGETYGSSFNEFNKGTPVYGNLGTRRAISWIRFVYAAPDVDGSINNYMTDVNLPENQNSHELENVTVKSSIPEYTIISECLITVGQKPMIAKQNAIGSDGNIKTYMGQDDYEIAIEGHLFNINPNEGQFPFKKMNYLQKIINSQANTLGIKIECPYLKLFGPIDSSGEPVGINYLVITDCEFPQEVGGYSQQKFKLTCISDSYPDTNNLYSAYV
jgi:hypothetical protein